jgi:hypothetical protein
MKKKTIKIISALIVLCMMFSLVACGNTHTTMQKKPVNNTASDNADSVVIDNDEIPLDVKVDENNNTFIKPEADNASGKDVAVKPLDKQNENSSEKLPAIVDKITDLFDFMNYPEPWKDFYLFSNHEKNRSDSISTVYLRFLKYVQNEIMYFKNYNQSKL